MAWRFGWCSVQHKYEYIVYMNNFTVYKMKLKVFPQHLSRNRFKFPRCVSYSSDASIALDPDAFSAAASLASSSSSVR